MKHIQSLLENIYGTAEGHNLYTKIQSSLLSQAELSRSTKSQDAWFTQSILYVTYADSFRPNGKNGDFASLAQEIPRIADLGCTAIHVLPFLSSPQVDAGFDVADYMNVREELAGNEGIEQFLSKCKEHDIRPFMDIILNHISEQHPWFLSAVEGDTQKQDYFISRNTPPPFSHTYENSAGVWAVYNEQDKERHVRIIFPEQVGEFPHWRKAMDGRWYYHTFYPQQLDINFCNPHVFFEFAAILIHWARKGFSFRLDAIEFIGKSWYFDSTQEQSTNFLIVETLREIVAHVNAESVFLAEASQVIDEVRPYFEGSTRPRRADLAYNFQLSKALFCALLGGAIDSLWERLADSAIKTNGGNWVTFLRTHDELSFEFAKPNEIRLLQTALIERGLPFRENYGRSGRLFSLLGELKYKHIGALFLMCSLPGAILLYYGDEYGTNDDHEFMRERTLLKQNTMANNVGISDDTRDINRAPIPAHDKQPLEALEIESCIRNIFRTRKKFPRICTTYPERIKSKLFSKQLFIGKYTFSDQVLITVMNLADQPMTIPYSTLNLQGDFTQELLVGDIDWRDHEMVVGSFAGAWLAYRT